MYVLFFYYFSLSGEVQFKTQEFESNISCMQAIEKLVGVETKSLKVKAFCVKK
jgi:hypothetical protein